MFIACQTWKELWEEVCQHEVKKPISTGTIWTVCWNCSPEPHHSYFIRIFGLWAQGSQFLISSSGYSNIQWCLRDKNMEKTDSVIWITDRHTEKLKFVPEGEKRQYSGFLWLYTNIFDFVFVCFVLWHHILFNFMETEKYPSQILYIGACLSKVKA